MSTCRSPRLSAPSVAEENPNDQEGRNGSGYYSWRKDPVVFRQGEYQVSKHALQNLLPERIVEKENRIFGREFVARRRERSCGAPAKGLS